LAHLWNDLGHTLSLKQHTLEIIGGKYPQDPERCLTEVLASWLNREDGPHNSLHLNWNMLIDALKYPGIGKIEIAEQIMQKIAGMIGLEIMLY